jgi:hypothetical protein
LGYELGWDGAKCEREQEKNEIKIRGSIMSEAWIVDHNGYIIVSDMFVQTVNFRRRIVFVLYLNSISYCFVDDPPCT